MDDIERLKRFCKDTPACACLDGTFEEFNKCCGKKYDIENPVEILFKMVADMSKKSTVPRLKDMAPEQATKALNKIFEVLDNEK